MTTSVRTRPARWHATVHAYFVISRLIVALPNTVPFAIGALAAKADPLHVGGAVVWAVGFYAYSCKVNDLADLPTDRLNKGRTRSPLIHGLISSDRVAFWAATELVLLMAVLYLSPITTVSKLALTGLIMLTTYGNAFQKRSRVIHPVVMDLLFGITMSAPIVIVCVGFGGSAALPLVLLSGSFLFQMVVLNSYSGNFKDLEHDLTVGSKTVALTLGVRRVGPNRWHLPIRYQAFLIASQVLSAVLLAASVWPDVIQLRLLGLSGLVLAFGGVVALCRRVKEHVDGTATALPAGESDRLTQYVSRPPHLFFNTLAFLVAAAEILNSPVFPVLVALAAIVPKLLLQLARLVRSTGQRS